VPVLACFSGWGGEMTATQQECVDKDIARRSNAQGEQSPGATAEGDMLDPVVVPDFASEKKLKKVI